MVPPSSWFDVTNTPPSCQSRTTCQTTSCRKPEHHNFKATKPSYLTLTARHALNSPAAVIISSQSGCRREAGARAALCNQMFAVKWELRPCAVATVWLSRSGKPYRRPSTYPTTGWTQLASSADSPQSRGRLCCIRHRDCHTRIWKY